MAFLLTLGTGTLILLAIVAFIILIALVENEQGSIATGFIFLVCVGFYYTGGKESAKDFLRFIQEHTGGFILTVVAYVVAGVVYSFVKWILFVRQSKANQHTKPTASYNKARLIRWISYWIFSIWWTLLNEPIKALVDQLGTSYDKIADKIYGD